MILRKLQYYESSGSDRHLRDVAMTLRFTEPCARPEASDVRDEPSTAAALELERPLRGLAEARRADGGRTSNSRPRLGR